jgi:hypothetical protein
MGSRVYSLILPAARENPRSAEASPLLLVAPEAAEGADLRQIPPPGPTARPEGPASALTGLGECCRRLFSAGEGELLHRAHLP